MSISENITTSTVKRNVLPESITADELKLIRKQYHMTQKEFADFLKVSKPTVERWESGRVKVTGPIVVVVDMLRRHPDYMEYISIPSKKMQLRLFYMYKNRVCTLIDVDEMNQKVAIRNYTDNLLFRAFGRLEHPTFQDYEEFLRSRCFPESRDKMKLVLNDLELPFYDPFLIISKTEGRMAEDDFWIKIER